MMQTPERTALKSGQRPAVRNVRTYKSGEVLFEEGAAGRELFIIEEGKVGVYKASAEGEIELAVLEAGSIIGEMSLLDAMPRSATVRAVDNVKALIISEGIFSEVLKKTPGWLTAIIKIVVNRLRDANKRVDQSVLRDKERGMVGLLLLLVAGGRAQQRGSQAAVDYDTVLVEAYYVCRLKKKEILGLLDTLRARELISVEEPTQGRKEVVLRDPEALALFDEYLLLRSRRRKFREIDIPDESVTALSNIAYTAQKSGTQTPEGTSVMRSAVEQEYSAKERERFGKQLLDLRRRGAVTLMPADDDTAIVFNRDTLNRIKKIREWLPRFEATYT